MSNHLRIQRHVSNLDSSYSPRMAVTSIDSQFCKESHCHRLDGTEIHHSDEASCSVEKIVNEQQVVHMVPPPIVQTRYILCSQ